MNAVTSSSFISARTALLSSLLTTPMSSSCIAKTPASSTRVASCFSQASMPPMNSIKQPWLRDPSRSSYSTPLMTPNSKSPLRILLELRPALAGHAGIPQATRLLFRSLASLGDFHVEGLMQSSEFVLPSGLPPQGPGQFGGLSSDQQLNRLGRIVIGIEQGTWDSRVRATAHTMVMALKHMLGGRQTLSRFEARHFQDFLWRRFFARTLPPADFDIVTRQNFRVARIPWLAMHICALVTRKMGYALFPRLDTS